MALADRDPGFSNPEEVVTFRLNVPPNSAENLDEVAETHQRIAHRIRNVPGVSSVGLGDAVPMDGHSNWNPLYVDGSSPKSGSSLPRRNHRWIDEGYLKTLQIPIIAGRNFSAADINERSAHVLVSESLARSYWGSTNAAIRQRLSLRPKPSVWYEVVGVVGDVLEDGIASLPHMQVYWPQVTRASWEDSEADEPWTWRTMSYAVRIQSTNRATLLHDLEVAVADVDPDLAALQLEQLDELLAASMARTAIASTLLAISGAGGLFFGIVAIYGVMTFAVTTQFRELGIRLALGASRAAVALRVVQHGVLLTSTGLLLGIGVAIGVSHIISDHMMADLLFDSAPLDVITYVAVSSILLTVAFGTTLVPAIRATRIDPATVMKAE